MKRHAAYGAKSVSAPYARSFTGPGRAQSEPAPEICSPLRSRVSAGANSHRSRLSDLDHLPVGHRTSTPLHDSTLQALLMTNIQRPWLLLWPLLWLIGAAALALMILLALAWYPVVGLALGVSLVWIGVRTVRSS
jgi:hypothetical protein